LSLAGLLWRRKALMAILTVSLAVRIVLVLKGGQFWDVDEFRYLRSFTFIHNVAVHDVRAILEQILSTPDHVGFILTGAPAAILHAAFLFVRSLPGTQSSVISTIWVSALCFTAPSVVSIALVYAISRRAGATSAETLLASFFMACSTAMFYYSRHLEPYDLSMALALFALWMGLSEEPSAWGSLRCGFIAGMAALTYNGYWILAAVVLAVHVLYHVSGTRAAAKRMVPAFIGAVSVPAFLTVISVLRGRPPYVSLMSRFAKTATQGDFHEGAALPELYLWDTEHAIAVVWAAGVLVALWYCRKDGWHKRPFILFCLAAVVVTYMMLVVGSVGMSKFVVYGRLVRQLIPWLCLASAGGIGRVFHNLGRVQTSTRRIAAALVGCAILIIQAGYNMSQAFRQHFPTDVRRMVYSRYGRVDYEVSFTGARVHQALLPGSLDLRQADPSSAYVLVNTEELYPLRSWKPPISGDVLFSIPHPYAYRPYQYEGLSPRERNLLLQGDYSMRLIRRLPVQTSGP
jgi:hypothetical protein